MRLALHCSLSIVLVVGVATVPAASSERGSALAGTVFLDRNGNGSRDEGEEGVVGERLRAVRALVEARRPAFLLVTGDLVRDALRVGEPEATGYFNLYVAETARFPVPVWSVPGNHDGGVHFVGLDTADVDDLWYYGHLDATQLQWLEGDLATVPATTRSTTSRSSRPWRVSWATATSRPRPP